MTDTADPVGSPETVGPAVRKDATAPVNKLAVALAVREAMRAHRRGKPVAFSMPDSSIEAAAVTALPPTPHKELGS